MNIDKLERVLYVIKLTGETQETIASESRKKELNSNRQLVMYFCANELKMPLKEIGRFMGGRDHSTIISGRDKFKGILSLPINCNFEAQRYKLIMKKYREKYEFENKNNYICAESISDELTADLSILMGKTYLTPIQNIVNEAKKSQLEKYINLVNRLKNELPIGEMDTRIEHTGSTAKAI
jgi:hypothetical protein